MYMDKEALDRAAEALRQLAEAVAQAAQTLDEIVKKAIEEIRKQCAKQEKTIPPRRTVSRARLPAIRRWWISYKARDCLPCIILKSGGKSTCQRKRSAFLIPSLP